MGHVGARKMKPKRVEVIDYEAQVSLAICCQRLQDLLDIIPKKHSLKAQADKAFAEVYSLKRSFEDRAEKRLKKLDHETEDRSFDEADSAYFGGPNRPGSHRASLNAELAEKGEGQLNADGRLYKLKPGRPSKADKEKAIAAGKRDRRTKRRFADLDFTNHHAASPKGKKD